VKELEKGVIVLLRSLKELTGYVVQATDGDVGEVHDLLFSDDSWILRYLVVDTRKWLPGRKVLIPPREMEEPLWQERRFPVSLTQKQVKESPSLDVDEPVSRQHEGALHRYFEWKPYWVGAIPFHRPVSYPIPDRDSKQDTDESESKVAGDVLENGDPHLRSTREVTGYRIEAPDGEIGHIDDLIAADDDWQIRYIVIDTCNWIPGKKVLLAVEWLDRFSWQDAKAFVDLSRKLIKDSPEFDPDKPVNREYEEILYDYYGRPRPPHWDE
jgi:hypothetical protein